MLIRMKTQYAGPRGTVAPGQVTDMPEGEAYELIEQGYAVQLDAESPVEDEAVVETAVETAPETATANPAREKLKKRSNA